MPTIGLDCNVILDGTGYLIQPDSFAMVRARVRRADRNRVAAISTLNGSGSGVGERYLDLGPGKREWHFIIPAFSAMRTLAGQAISSTGQQIRNALHASYEKVNTPLSFTDPVGSVWSVRFDHLEEGLVNVRAQADGQLQYILHVTLIEA